MNKVLVDYKYTNEDVVNTLKLLSPRTTNMNPVRIGNAIDGGYVLLEELIKQNGITYSFGVGHTNLFEQEMQKELEEMQAKAGGQIPPEQQNEMQELLESKIVGKDQDIQNLLASSLLCMLQRR